MERVDIDIVRDLLPNTVARLPFTPSIAIMIPSKSSVTSDDILRWGSGERLLGRYSMVSAYAMIFFETKEDATMFFLEFVGSEN